MPTEPSRVIVIRKSNKVSIFVGVAYKQRLYCYSSKNNTLSIFVGVVADKPSLLLLQLKFFFLQTNQIFLLQLKKNFFFLR